MIRTPGDIEEGRAMPAGLETPAQVIVVAQDPFSCLPSVCKNPLSLVVEYMQKPWGVGAVLVLLLVWCGVVSYHFYRNASSDSSTFEPSNHLPLLIGCLLAAGLPVFSCLLIQAIPADQRMLNREHRRQNTVAAGNNQIAATLNQDHARNNERGENNNQRAEETIEQLNANIESLSRRCTALSIEKDSFKMLNKDLSELIQRSRELLDSTGESSHDVIVENVCFTTKLQAVLKQFQDDQAEAGSQAEMLEGQVQRLDSTNNTLMQEVAELGTELTTFKKVLTETIKQSTQSQEDSGALLGKVSAWFNMVETAEMKQRKQKLLAAEKQLDQQREIIQATLDAVTKLQSNVREHRQNNQSHLEQIQIQAKLLSSGKRLQAAHRRQREDSEELQTVYKNLEDLLAKVQSCRDSETVSPETCSPVTVMVESGLSDLLKKRPAKQNLPPSPVKFRGFLGTPSRAERPNGIQYTPV